MVKADLTADGRIEIAAPPESVSRLLGTVEGIKRSSKDAQMTAPLSLSTVEALEKLRAHIGDRLDAYAANARRVLAYTEKQKRLPADAVNPFAAPRLRNGVTMYAHQVRAYNIACALLCYAHGVDAGAGAMHYLANGACALLMDMGTGKSLTTIAVMGYMQAVGRVRKALVIAPSSVCPVWEAELKKFAEYPYRTAVLTGTADERRKRLKNLRASPPDVLQVAVINYESAWRLEDALNEFAADLIICDESQRIKTHTAKQSKAIHRLGDKANYRMILTGTPIQKDTRDVWSQYRFLAPETFPYTFYKFQAKFALMGGFEGKQYIAPRNNDELTQKIHRIAYRVRKEECLDLPEKMFEERPCPLSAKAAQLYMTLKKEAIAELEGMEITAQHVLTRMLRLQQLSGGFITTDAGEIVQADTAKLDALRDIIETLCLDEGGKLVVFTRFHAETDAVEKMAVKLLAAQGLRLVRIDGSVDIKNRGGIVDDFQHNPACRIFLGIIDACAEGLTLTAAQTAVYYSQTWNYAKWDQSLARIHRIGQTGACTYISLIAPGTIDEKIAGALKNKEDLARSVVDNWRQLLEG